MADHAVTITQREGSGSALDIVIRTSERNGRWISRAAYDGTLANPDDWPCLAEEGDTQRVWIADNEPEVVMTAINYLRTLYDVRTGTDTTLG